MEQMDALAVMMSWFVVAFASFAAVVVIVRRLDDSHPRHRRYGTSPDRGPVA
jgi:hypothetical protein